MTRKVLATAGLLLPSLFACSPSTDAEPTPSGRTDEIRNGTRAPEAVDLTEGQILALGWLAPTGRASANFCTGTLVAPNIVATAEHCVEGRRSGTIQFGIGLDPSDPVATFRAVRVHAHSSLDAAILVLDQDVTEAVPEIEPIPFNREPLDDSLVGRGLQAGGYGQTYDRSRTGRYFATVELVRIRPNEVVVDGNGLQGICFGDSGGPVITVLGEGESARPYVLGVESWGDPSCVGVDHLTRLDVIADWIDEVSAEEPPEPEPGACGDIDYLGQCDGTVAEWCTEGRVERRDCADRGMICTFVDDTTGYFCAEPPNNCGEISSSGVCEGDTVVRCRFGELVETDCAANGEECAEDGGGAYCTPPWPPAPEPEADMGPGEADMGPDEADMAAPDPQLPEQPEAERSQKDDGCSAAPGGSSSPTPALALLGLLGLARRRRRA